MPIPDARHAGRSRAVPYIYGEPSDARHGRRIAAALKVEGKVRAWCGNARVALVISNEGHHWRFTRGTELAEWWPSSAKLVFGKRWHEGIHVHDATQLLRELKARWSA